MVQQIHIFSNDDDWEPSRTVVNRLLKQMAAKGLRRDWQFCHTTNDRSLLFSIGDSKTPAIIARKTGVLTNGHFSLMKEVAEKRSYEHSFPVA